MSRFKTIVKLGLRRLGYDVSRIAARRNAKDGNSDYEQILSNYSAILTKKVIRNVNYGSGHALLKKEGWLNVDRLRPLPTMEEPYLKANLAERHPFPSGCFQHAFAEDFLEHLTQDESLVFLSEAFRTLHEKGVLRLSFRGLKAYCESTIGQVTSRAQVRAVKKPLPSGDTSTFTAGTASR